MSGVLRRSADYLRAGEYDRAEQLAHAGYLQAKAAGQVSLSIQLLGNRGGAQMSLHQFRAALASYQEAQALADRQHMGALSAALTANIASLYSQLGEIEAASTWLERSLAQLSGESGDAYRPRVQVQLATIRMREDRIEEACRLFGEAIEASERRADYAFVSQIWNLAGEQFHYRGDLAAAEQALLESWRIRAIRRLPGDAPYFNLGKVRLSQGRFAEAGVIFDRVLERMDPGKSTLSLWDIYLSRGRVLMEQGKYREALGDLRKARRLAQAWRWAAPGDDAARIGVEGTLQQVHDALVDSVNKLYLQTHDAALLEEGFSTEDENHAASLRASLADPHKQDPNLPASFWRTVSRLQEAEVEALRVAGPATNRQVRAARAELVANEAGSGVPTAAGREDLLAAVRARLGANAAVFAFHLGAEVSWLWAVDRDGADLFRLPPAAEVNSVLSEFTDAVERDSGNLPEAAARAYAGLFGTLDPRFRQRSRWILVLDGQLHHVPLAALVDGTTGEPAYLVQVHSIETVPAISMLLTANQEQPGHGFVGLGDAIYNRADPRCQESKGIARWLPGERTGSRPLLLPRLAASAVEIENCARTWGGPSTLLQGASATRERLRGEIENNPSIIHVAAHFLRSSQRPGYALMALSLDPTGRTEIVAPHEIAHWRMAARLVVLSGCDSAAGEPIPGTGVFGLSRAWIAAGARHVVATHWSTADQTGALLVSLYRHLREQPQSGAEVALCRAQRDMIGTSGWTSRPSYWAAFFGVGTAQLTGAEPL